MATFTQDDKREISQSLGFYDEGVYEVKIVAVDAGTTEKGSEYFEFEVADTEGREGKVRTYFTDAAKPYSFNTIRSIFVHNTVEKNKEAVRKEVDECEDTDALLKLCQELRGKDAWLLVQYTGETYTSPKNGKVYKNMNSNLYGYAPTFTPTPQSAEPAQTAPSDTGEITKDNVEQVFPFGN